MHYTLQQQEEFKHEFSTRRKRQIWVASPVVMAVFVFAFLNRLDKSRGDDVMGIPLIVWFPVLATLVIGLIAFTFQNWRCPACNRYLGREIGPQFCPKCGVALQ